MSGFGCLQGARPQETIRFSRACNAAGAQIRHIPRTAERLRLAVSRRSTGQTARLSRRFAHLLAVSAAKPNLIHENVTWGAELRRYCR